MSRELILYDSTRTSVSRLYFYYEKKYRPYCTEIHGVKQSYNGCFENFEDAFLHFVTPENAPSGFYDVELLFHSPYQRKVFIPMAVVDYIETGFGTCKQVWYFTDWNNNIDKKCKSEINKGNYEIRIVRPRYIFDKDLDKLIFGKELFYRDIRDFADEIDACLNMEGEVEVIVKRNGYWEDGIDGINCIIEDNFAEIETFDGDRKRIYLSDLPRCSEIPRKEYYFKKEAPSCKLQNLQNSP